MKKMIPWMITILLAITLIAVVAIFLFNQFFNDSSSTNDPLKTAQDSVKQVTAKPLSADKRVELTTQVDDIKTNLSDTSYLVVMGLAFQLDSKATKDDFEKLKDIQIKPIIIRVLSDMSPEDISGSKGKDMLSSTLLNQINPVLPEGKIIKIEITNFIITSL